MDKFQGRADLRRALMASFVVFAALFVAGCPHGNQDYKVGTKAELVGDYDTAYIAFEKALKQDPSNANYKLRALRARFEAGQFHVEQGQKDLNNGRLEMALGEFQKAEAIDPSSEIARQEAQKTLDLVAKVKEAEQPKPVGVAPPEDTGLMSAPPELKPLSREPINLKMTNDARVIFETIGQLAGLSVIFDPSYVSRRELEDEEVQTFYLRNNSSPQDLTEIVNGLRQLLDITRIQPMASDNAIVIRSTPDKLLLASKIIRSLDKAKPEVVIQVDVLEARLDREHELGIQPGQSATLAFTPVGAVQPASTTTSGPTGTTTNTGGITLNNLKHLSTADYSLTLPGATLNALLTDSTTRVIQDLTIRLTEGSTAKLDVGDRVPVAVSTLTPGVGVASGVGGINTFGSTSFQYQDVGVAISVTPHVHPDGDVSMKLLVNVSSVTGEVSNGGLQQPIISQRKAENDIRLKDGEVNILGGLITRSETKSLSGWPGLAHIPFLRYFFSSQDNKIEDDEVLIALTPHVVRMPSISADDLRTLAAGTDTNVRVYEKGDELTAPTVVPTAPSSPAANAAPGTSPAAGPATSL